MSKGPVQLVVNADDYRAPKENPAGGGPPTDFFAGRDSDFARHRGVLLTQMSAVGRTLAAQPHGSVGVAKVTLRKRAWAKSHRPTTSLFRQARTPLLGGGDLGQLLVEVTPASIAEVAREVAEAEAGTTWVERDGRELAVPSRRRSETGAIAAIELFGRADKRRFSAAQAAAWLRDRRTGGAYRVELFAPPAPPEALSALSPDRRRLFETFEEGLRAFGGAARFRPVELRGRGSPAFGIRLVQQAAQPRLPLRPGRAGDLAPFDPTPQRHEELLAFLDSHPLVRRVSLPSRPVVSDAAPARRAVPTGVSLPPKVPGAYPRVGVIDGGLGSSLDDWTVARYGFLDAAHRDAIHGTFIGGLLVGGRALNGEAVVPEADGCELVDVDVFPSGGEDVFEEYFGEEGVLGFLAEVGSAVATCRRRHGTRVFNLSINAEEPASLDHYSEEARMLDAIAEENDAILVVSAGNLTDGESRPEWSSEPEGALTQLAMVRGDGLASPAESVRNVGVAALNPPGLAHAVRLAPACYSRRGPGLRSGVKPDFGHVGGAGTEECELGSGLFSVAEDGTVYSHCGTSFAAPLVAKTLAALDARIEGEVPRETLLALAVHNADVPESLKHRALSGVARHMAGFGCLKTSDEMLEADEDEITLVFASRLDQGGQLIFPFSWPRSLSHQGNCRGEAKLTLVASPPLDYRFGAEFVRVNVEGALQQWDAARNHGQGGWVGRLRPAFLPDSADHAYEAELIEHGLKWSPTKIYAGGFPRGVGRSSDWRLSVGYLTRSAEQMPEAGVPFTAVLTIRDPKGEAPVFNDLRQTLQSLGVRTSDVRTAARVMPRV